MEDEGHYAGGHPTWADLRAHGYWIPQTCTEGKAEVSIPLRLRLVDARSDNDKMAAKEAFNYLLNPNEFAVVLFF